MQPKGVCRNCSRWEKDCPLAELFEKPEMEIQGVSTIKGLNFCPEMAWKYELKAWEFQHLQLKEAG